jgi:hypothetical protein
MFENELYGLAMLRDEARQTADELSRLARLKVKLGLMIDAETHPLEVSTEGAVTPAARQSGGAK